MTSTIRNIQNIKRAIRTITVALDKVVTSDNYAVYAENAVFADRVMKGQRLLVKALIKTYNGYLRQEWRGKTLSAKMDATSALRRLLTAFPQFSEVMMRGGRIESAVVVDGFQKRFQAQKNARVIAGICQRIDDKKADPMELYLALKSA